MRVIRIKYMGHKRGMRMFRIVSQSHRGADFCPKGRCVFTASDGFELSSGLHPAYYLDIPRELDTVWVRGSESETDESIITVPVEVYHRVKAAVAEYNKTGGFGYGI